MNASHRKHATFIDQKVPHTQRASTKCRPATQDCISDEPHNILNVPFSFVCVCV